MTKERARDRVEQIQAYHAAYYCNVGHLEISLNSKERYLANSSSMKHINPVLLSSYWFHFM